MAVVQRRCDTLSGEANQRLSESERARRESEAAAVRLAALQWELRQSETEVGADYSRHWAVTEYRRRVATSCLALGDTEMALVRRRGPTHGPSVCPILRWGHSGSRCAAPLPPAAPMPTSRRWSRGQLGRRRGLAETQPSFAGDVAERRESCFATPRHSCLSAPRARLWNRYGGSALTSSSAACARRWRRGGVDVWLRFPTGVSYSN